MDNHGQNEEFNALIQGVMPMAERMLDELGAFLPYAAVLYRDGEIKHLTVDPDSGSHDAQAIVTALERTLFDLISSTSIDSVAVILSAKISSANTLVFGSSDIFLYSVW